jgi:aryl-alcohol dehydrogenase-like predicted oxidoreductase
MNRTQTALKTTQLGETGLEITRLGFGAWSIGGGGSQHDERSTAAIQHALADIAQIAGSGR